jgi:hypothetical protein
MSIFWLVIVFAVHCHGGAADKNAMYHQCGTAEDGDTYHGSSVADKVSLLHIPVE